MQVQEKKIYGEHSMLDELNHYNVLRALQRVKMLQK
jgi:hypothetical protein